MRKPMKVHMFKQDRGEGWGTACGLSSLRTPELLSTEDPSEVTCTNCRRIIEHKHPENCEQCGSYTKGQYPHWKCPRCGHHMYG